jgi:uncharacterized membrane protein YesL
MYKRFAPGKGVTKPSPDRGIKLFFFILYTHFWELVKLNLLLLVFCIPIVTIPAAFCAANRVIINLICEWDSFVWSDFITEFKASFFRSIPFGLLFAFLMLDSYFAYCMSFSENGISIPIMALAAFLYGLTVIFFSYVFIFLPAFALKNKHIAKNAFIFMLTEWKTNLVIVGAAVAMTHIIAVIAAHSILIAIFIFMLIYYSLNKLIICSAAITPMKRRIIEPFEQKQETVHSELNTCAELHK